MRIQVEPIPVNCALGVVVGEYLDMPTLENLQINGQICEKIDDTEGIVAYTVNFPAHLLPDELKTEIIETIKADALAQMEYKELDA